MTWLNGFARGLGAVALSIALVVGAGTMRTAGANQPDGHIVALAYDPGTDTLMKAYAGALYRSGDGGNEIAGAFETTGRKAVQRSGRP